MLNEAGFTSVVATNCDQEYLRPIVLGDRLTVTSVIDSVSPEKHTGLGDGHFVTTRLEFTDQHGELVATMRFRILRFRPQAARTKADAPLRPRPALTQDIAFFFEGARQGTLLIQRCAGVRPAAPPAAPGLRVVRVLRMGHRHRQRARHGLQLRRRAPPAGRRVRLPPAHRGGRARGGDAAGGRPDRRRSCRRAHRHARGGRDGGRRRRAHHPHVPAGRTTRQGAA